MPDRVNGIDRSLTIQLLRTRESLMQHFRPLLQSLNITEQQWRVLRSLYPTQCFDATQLANEAAILPSSLTRILKKLEGDGLIQTVHPDADRRRVNISLSTAGQEFIAGALPESRRIYAAIRDAVGTARMESVYDMLSEIARRCEELTVPPHSDAG